MSFEKGHTKLGGRQKGTPNKRHLLRVEDILLELDINPIQRLIEIAESSDSSIDQKINCYKEIAKYAFPKQRARDSKTTAQLSFNVVTGIDRAPDSLEE